MIIVLSAVGALAAGLVLGSWWGGRRFWIRCCTDRAVGHEVIEKLGGIYGARVELHEVGR